MRVVQLVPLLLLAAPVAAQDARPTEIEVTLSSFRFTPETIAMVHGQRYVLHLANTSKGGHDFAAPDFFTAAVLAPEERAKAPDGRVEVPGGGRVDIALTAPAAGRYRLRCTHTLHTAFGMKGAIVVS